MSAKDYILRRLLKILPMSTFLFPLEDIQLDQDFLNIFPGYDIYLRSL